MINGALAIVRFGRGRTRPGLMVYAAAMALAAGASASASPQAPVVASVPEVSTATGALSNGVAWSVTPGSTGEPVILSLTVAAGWFDEDADQIGLAHLLEHVVAQEGAGRLRRFGLSLGVGIEAKTHQRDTQYRITLADASPERLAAAAEALRAFAFGARLDPAVVDAERIAVIHETELGDDPELRAEMALRAFVVANPCEDPANGIREIESVRTAPLNALRRFHDDWYRADQMRIDVHGPVDVGEVVSVLEIAFKSAPARATLRGRERRARCVGTPPEGLSAVRISREQPDRIEILVGTRRRATGPSDLGDRDRDALLNTVLAQRARAVAARYNAPIADVSLSKNYQGWSDDLGVELFSARATVEDPSDVRTTVQGLAAMIADLSARGLNPKDLTGLSADPSAGSGETPLANLQSLNAALREATDVHAGAVVIVLAPDATLAGLPNETELRSLASAGFASTDPVDWAPSPRIESLMTPEEIQALVVRPIRREEDAASGVVDLTLANGLHVRFRETQGEGPVRVSIRRRLADDGRARIAEALNIARHSGVGPFDRFSVDDYLNRTAIALEIGVQGSVFIDLQATDPSLEAALQLFNLMVRRPRFDMDAWRDWRSKRERSDIAPAVDPVSAILDSHLGRARPPESGRQEPLDLATAEDVYREFFKDPGAFDAVVTGPISEDELEPLLARYLGALPASSSPQAGSSEDPRLERPVLPARHRAVVQGPGDRASVTIAAVGPRPENLKDQILIEMLGGVLQRRIFHRIREIEGGAYAPLGAASASGSVYTLIAEFVCDPDQAEALAVAAVEEIEAMGRGEIDVQLFTAAREIAQGGRSVLGIPLTWHEYLIAHTAARPVDFDPGARRRILDTLTLEEVQAAGRRYAIMDHALELIALPSTPSEMTGQPR